MFCEEVVGKFKGIFVVVDELFVFCDFKCFDVFTFIDVAFIMVMGDDMLKVVVWYDNEWGYL